MPDDLFTHDFSVSFNLQLGYTIEGRELVITVRSAEVDTPEPIRIPLTWFHSFEQAGEFLRGLDYFLKLTITSAAIRNSALHVNDAANLHALESGLLDESPNDLFTKLANQHRDAIRNYCREYTGLDATNSNGQGQFSKWTPLSLTLAIQEAMADLEPNERTYEKVNEKLREHHKSKAPHSANALKTLVNSWGINWKHLKRPPQGDPFAFVLFRLGLQAAATSPPKEK